MIKERSELQGKTTATVEEYLEAIYNMRVDGTAPIAARLAERLGLSISTVMATLRRMERDGIITLETRREIALTEHGVRLAESLLRRHRLAERLLTDVLRVPWHEAHVEACILEHAISSRLEGYLDEALGHPERCPHGNPIPGNGAVVDSETQPLSDLAPSTHAVVEHLSEMAERQPDFLLYLNECHIRPGSEIVIERSDYFSGTLVVSIGGNPVVLGVQAAKHIWARPIP